MSRRGLSRYIAVFAGLLCAVSLQAMMSSDEDVEGFGYLGVGTASLDVASVNTALDQFGATDFTDRPLAIVFGMHTLLQRLVAETELQSLFWNSKSAGTARADLWGGTAMLSLGVNFTEPESVWQLYPYAGAGIGIWKLSMHPKTVAFEQALTTPPPPAPIWQPTFVADFGGGLVRTFRSPQKKSLMSIGIRGGYLYDPTRSSTWMADGAQVTGGPDLVMSGPYVKVFIGKGYSACQPERTSEY